MEQLNLPFPPPKKTKRSDRCPICGGRVIDGVCVWGNDCKPDWNKSTRGRTGGANACG